MGVVLLVAALIVFGVGYLLGALFLKDFVGDQYRWVGGVLGGFGAIALIVGVIYAGCSATKF
jgi:hypothetical protein